MNTDYLVRALIMAGSLIMVINIFLYVRLERYIVREWKVGKEVRGLYVPITLLVLFLAGYLAVGIFGRPDIVMAGILFGGSVFVLAIFRIISDLAEKVRRTESLRVDLQAAEKASKSKTVFLSNMSHDIRTPLNAIIGYASLAEEEDTTEEQVRTYVHKIGISGKHLLDLINDILEMSRIESGRMHLDEQPVDIIQIFDDVDTVFTDQMKTKNIAFSVDTSGVEDRYVMCDRVRFSRVLMNLVSNAYKFTPEGGMVAVVLKQKKPVSGDMSVSEYILTVEDNGIGMSEEFAARVFESFERERTSTVSSIQGTGLGLAITRSIVEMMNGSIEVETEKDKGSTFTVRIPMAAADTGTSPETESIRLENQDCRCADGMRVLLAEDVEVNREIAVMILSNMGFCVETACNGKEAVEMLMASEPGYYNAVLMDVQMPVMNGYEATRMIRSLEDPDLAAVPVIAVTANAFAEDIQDAMDAGMDGHIAKPLDPQMIAKVLRPLILGSCGADEDINQLKKGNTE